MRPTILFLCLILVNINVFAQISASPPPPRVVTGDSHRNNYILKEDGFQIDFPAKPVRTISSIDTAFGKTNMVNYKLAASLAFYGVSIIDFPTVIEDKTEINLRLDALRIGLLKEPQSRLISETEISFGGNVGREFVLENTETTLTVRALFIKQRFFQLTIATKGSLLRSSDRVKNFNKKTTEKYINSFYVTDLAAPSMTAAELPKDFGIEIKNEKFSSKFLGFSMNVPQNWTIVEKEQTEMFKDLSAQKFENSTAKIDESLAFSLKNTEFLLVATKTQLESSVSSASLLIAAEKVSFPNFVPLKMVEAYSKNYIEASEKVLGKPGSTKLSGVDFAWIEIGDAKLNSRKRIYIANRKGIALEIFLIYQKEDELNILLDSLQSVKFE